MITNQVYPNTIDVLIYYSHALTSWATSAM